MKLTYKRPKGEEYCKVSWKIKETLNNTKIDRVEAYLFFYTMVRKYDLDERMKLVFSGRKLPNDKDETWGYAKYPLKIVLYRHSIWVFLHELSHMITDKKNISRAWHGKHFGKNLDLIYSEWFKFKKVV